MKRRPVRWVQVPQALPPWQSIMEDLGQPPAGAVASLLGVGVRSVYRWNRSGQAPRSAVLAMFWMTRWGRSEVDCEAVNRAQLATAYAQALEREMADLQAKLDHALALNSTGAANDPIERQG